MGEARRKKDRAEWDGKRLADLLLTRETPQEDVVSLKSHVREKVAELGKVKEYARSRFAEMPIEKRSELEARFPEVYQSVYQRDELEVAWDWEQEKSVEVTAEIRAALNRVPIISADNVAAYLFDSGVQSMGIEDFPAVAPPFPAFWVEVRRTPQSIIDRLGGGLQWGALFRASEVIGGGWRMTAHHVLSADGQVLVLDKPTVVMVAPDGTPTAWERAQGLGDASNPLDRFEFVAPLLMAVAFMNCANVEHYEVEPPRALSLKREKRHGRPLVRYRVIEISPKTRAQSGDGPITSEGHKALHICRGHFARYTTEAPLFGHFVGTVWRPAHVRGRASEGVVKKDYRVKAPLRPQGERTP